MRHDVGHDRADGHPVCRVWGLDLDVPEAMRSDCPGRIYDDWAALIRGERR